MVDGKINVQLIQVNIQRLSDLNTNLIREFLRALNTSLKPVLGVGGGQHTQ
jgi:hypothetical protein